MGQTGGRGINIKWIKREVLFVSSYFFLYLFFPVICAVFALHSNILKYLFFHEFILHFTYWSVLGGFDEVSPRLFYEREEWRKMCAYTASLLFILCISTLVGIRVICCNDITGLWVSRFYQPFSNVHHHQIFIFMVTLCTITIYLS